MTLYLKYRPQLIDELDLESVRTQLKNIIKSGNIPHSFLFSGPKGTGKTSSARILAKVLNCEHLTPDGEPCNVCDSCISITKGNNIDIIELDAASNRGIDDIRNLKEGIYLSPVGAKKKVYIIDEAHMLTLEASNAFLKTLEEPPDHAVFILATTNPEKLPGTVISRLTRVDFTKASENDIARQLNRVAKGEGLTVEPPALKKISKLADGSFRDAVKILENLSFKTKDIKDGDIVENSSDIASFFQLLKTRKAKPVLEFVENLVKNGISIKNFTDNVIESIHQSVLAKNGIGEDLLSGFELDDLINLNDLITLSQQEISPIHQLPFEIALVKFCGEKAITTKQPEPKITLESVPSQKKIEIAVETEIKPIPKIKLSGKNMDKENWQKLLDGIRSKNFGIEALLRAATPLDYDGESLVLGTYYKFHKEKLEDMKNTKILEDLCKETFGTERIKITYELIDKPLLRQNINQSEPISQPLTPNVDKDIIDAAKEIFG